jgi:hypothetical protein
MIRVLAALFFVTVAARPGTQSAAAPADEAAVLAVVDRFMEAVSTKDVALLASLRLDGSTNIVEQPAAAGGTRVTRRVFTPENMGTGVYRERYWDPIVHIRGSIAVVWTPYEFWRDGKTSHCGIDVFEMVKQDGAWRIANMMWTVEPDACPALRPSDPARIRPKS